MPLTDNQIPLIGRGVSQLGREKFQFSVLFFWKFCSSRRFISKKKTGTRIRLELDARCNHAAYNRRSDGNRAQVYMPWKAEST